MSVIIAHCDAGKRGHGAVGPAACGVILDGAVFAVRTKYLGETTTNEAEWSGLILTLELALEQTVGDVLMIYMDSKLVVNQALGKWRVNTEHLKPYHHRATELANQLRSRGIKVEITWVPRGQNKQVDALVRNVLDRMLQ